MFRKSYEAYQEMIYLDKCMEGLRMARDIADDMHAEERDGKPTKA